MITAGSLLDRYILLPAWLIDRSNLFQSHSMKNCNWSERWPIYIDIATSLFVYPCVCLLKCIQGKSILLKKYQTKLNRQRWKELTNYPDFSNYLQVFNIFITISSSCTFFCLYIHIYRKSSNKTRGFFFRSSKCGSY